MQSRRRPRPPRMTRRPPPAPLWRRLLEDGLGPSIVNRSTSYSGCWKRLLMSRLMLVTPHIAHAPTGGRALLSQLNLKCLEAILADRLVVHALDRARNSGWRSRADAL